EQSEARQLAELLDRERLVAIPRRRPRLQHADRELPRAPRHQLLLLGELEVHVYLTAAALAAFAFTTFPIGSASFQVFAFASAQSPHAAGRPTGPARREARRRPPPAGRRVDGALEALRPPRARGQLIQLPLELAHRAPRLQPGDLPPLRELERDRDLRLPAA